MKLLLKTACAILSVVLLMLILSLRESENKTVAAVVSKETLPKIQVAILLDVSNSMDGLIEQAKAQLWNTVSVMGKAQCNGNTPDIEIALYEYGRPANSVSSGYVKQINGFINDVDSLSQNLFGLTTNGGDEFCGHVIYTSVKDLAWDTLPDSYRVIFIAGNEDFLQGDISWTTACAKAKKKGIIINTIYCGEKTSGVREHWNLGGECSNGSYTNIDQNAKIEDIATPYDSTIFALNEQLNGTYISYGYAGALRLKKQSDMDRENRVMNEAVAVKRISVKSNKKLYKTSGWDLVDATAVDSSFAAKVDMKTLPDNLKNKSRKELQQVIKDKNDERNQLQKSIQDINAQREVYIAAEKKKTAVQNNTSTLETEIEKIIKVQARRFNIIIQ